MPTLLMAQSNSEIVQQIDRACTEMRSLDCDFTQTKHIKLLNDEMISYGKMYFSQPNMLRWEYTSPYTYTFVINANQVLLKNAQREDVLDVNNNKMFKEIARLMMGSVVGSCLTDESTFKTTIATTSTEWVATLVPIKRDLKQMWSHLIIHFDRARKSVVKVEMYEPSGDYTIIELRNIRHNVDIEPSVFSIN
jgi:outer membrane lipoprotein carrier protein